MVRSSSQTTLAGSAPRTMSQKPDMRRGRILFSGARGAKPQARHGPLQRLLAGRPLAFPPQARIACRMQHCHHDDMPLREDVEHAEGKPLYKRAAELAAHKTKGHWIGFDAAERRVHLCNEPRTEALMLLVVPQLRSRQIGLCVTADNQ